MNATQTMEAVHIYVPTQREHISVAAELDTNWLTIAEAVKV